MNDNLDKERVVNILADTLNIFGKAEVLISFETETQVILTVVSDFFENIELLSRIKIISETIGIREELRKYEFTIFPLTANEKEIE
jgi:hypothetical protein